MINRDTGQYHTVYSANRDLGRVPMTMAQTAEPVERLTFAIESRRGRRRPEARAGTTASISRRSWCGADGMTARGRP